MPIQHDLKVALLHLEEATSSMHRAERGSFFTGPYFAWTSFFSPVSGRFLTYVFLYCCFGAALWLRGVTGTRFPGVHGHRPLEVSKGPWSLWGSREYALMGTWG